MADIAACGEFLRDRADSVIPNGVIPSEAACLAWWGGKLWDAVVGSDIGPGGASPAADVGGESAARLRASFLGAFFVGLHEEARNYG